MFSTKFSTTLSVLLVLGFSHSSAFAGNGASGGGEAVLCYKTPSVLNKVYEDLRAAEDRLAKSGGELLDAVDLQLSNLRQPPQTLDFFEATRPTGIPSATRKMNALATNGATPTQIYAAIDRIDPEFMKLFRPYISKDSQWKAHEGVVRLHDSNTSYLFKQGCMKVQVAFFNDDSKTVYYNSNITSLMDQANLDALKLHEDFYSFHRAGLRSIKAIAIIQNEVLSRGEYLFEKAAVWTKAVMNSTPNSDSSRALVGYLITNKTYIKREFCSFSVAVAVGVFVERGWKNQGPTSHVVKFYNPYKESPLQIKFLP